MNFMTTNIVFYLLILFIIPCFGCLESSAKLNNELVMSNGMIIEATNSNGVISVKAGEGLERTYAWNDKKENYCIEFNSATTTFKYPIYRGQLLIKYKSASDPGPYLSKKF